MNRPGVSKVLLAVIVIVLLVVIAALATLSMKPQAPEQKPSAKPSTQKTTNATTKLAAPKPETLVLGQPEMEPTTLDPHVFYDSESGRVIRLVYEKLVDYKGGSTTEYVPSLAVSWEHNSDYTVWTFHLRKGVKFHDGTPFNATAVKFSFDRYMGIYNLTGEPPEWIFADVIDKVEVVDPYTVKFVLKHSEPNFLARIASLWGFYIVSPSCVYKHKTKDDPWATKWFQDHECGTGPYVLKEWSHHDHIKLVKFDDYWGGWKNKPNGYIGEVIIREITETATLRQALLNGEVDMVLGGTTYEDIPLFEKNPNIKVYENPSFNCLYVFINTEKPPFNNINVRKALVYAVNYKELVDIAVYGHGKPMKGPLPSSMPGWDPSVPMYTYDVQKAVNFLKEAGLSGKSLKLTYGYVQGDETERKVGEALKNYFETLGKKAGVQITVELKPMTWDVLYNVVTSNPKEAPELAALYWWPDYVDPVNYLYPMFYSDSDYNWAHLKDKKLDDLLDKASSTSDPKEKNELVKEIQRRIIDDVPAVFCFELTQVDVARSNVKGYTYNPMFILTVNAYDMWKETKG